MAVQEAVPVEDNPHIARIFGSEILGCLPVTGNDRVRRTALLLIGGYLSNTLMPLTDPHLGSYASWFTTQSSKSTPTTSLLMNAVSYIASALPDPALCLPAANALRDLCDANREALAPHINAFGELHANMTGMPVSRPCVPWIIILKVMALHRILRGLRYSNLSRA